ncbi:MAG: ABC transporter substrate-binding protein [Deltaproteobacteria bacterium]|nr:ABC transporter substrate-binding protein [Deltaproteobacteria bacterium]MBW2122225.1 ABC transporter substrate-binding protein [Deltaproteobacteria bacterium]
MRTGGEGIVDIRGFSFQPLEKPFSVVSLVPSWTETLFYFGLSREEIAGRTDYCIHPRGRVEGVETVGGPRDPNLERIFELDPDLIIADREENRKEDVEEMDGHWPASRVFVTGPRSVDEALGDVARLGRLFHARGRARRLIESVRASMARIRGEGRGTVAYVVWQDPWIVAGGETYIGDIIRILGYENVADRPPISGPGRERRGGYPAVTIEDLARLRPDAVFLSTEPFPFRRRHADLLRSLLGGVDAEYAGKVNIRIVDGEYFSWYGSRMIAAFRYFSRHRASL